MDFLTLNKGKMIRGSKLRKARKACSGDFLHKRLTDTVVLTDIINAGSFGEIYLGVCKETNAHYAVKVEKKRQDKKAKGLK